MEIPEKISNILTKNYFGYICTVDGKNQPHVAPMFFVYNPIDMLIYFITSAKSKKLRNIKTNPYISLTVDIRDPENPFRNEGVLVQGIVKKNDLKPLYLKSRIWALKGVIEMFVDKYTKVVVTREPEDDILVSMHIKKMVHWKGPRFISIRV